jgi:predicted HTH domain antitoxin
MANTSERSWHPLPEQRYREVMGMTLNIPDSVLQGLRIPEGEIAQRLRTELAIALYAQGELSLGKAAELAEMDRMPFGELVGQRGIARHYGDAELVQDVSYSRSEQHLADLQPRNYRPPQAPSSPVRGD